MSKFNVGDIVVANSNCPKISKQQDELKAGYNGWTEQYKAFLEGTFGVVKAFYDGDEGYEIGVSGFSSTFQTGEYYDSIKLYERTAQKPDAVSPKQTALEKQVSGDHYKDFKIQPVEYIYANNIPFLEANVIKYTSRHRAKNKAADIKKAIHCLELILQMEYCE